MSEEVPEGVGKDEAAAAAAAAGGNGLRAELQEVGLEMQDVGLEMRRTWPDVQEEVLDVAPVQPAGVHLEAVVGVGPGDAAALTFAADAAATDGKL